MTRPPCVPNIGEAGRRRRLVGGVVWLAAGAGLTIALRVGWVPRPAGLALPVLFTLAAVGWFQARERT